MPVDQEGCENFHDSMATDDAIYQREHAYAGDEEDSVPAVEVADEHLAQVLDALLENDRDDDPPKQAAGSVNSTRIADVAAGDT
mmetsp:Transcript_14499/g.34962  ORF Transcript_14499/g.34962 Transcript_14499/m.34962 type:complete len:84 (+) Transcript_14499:755-1006(+)